MTDDDAILDVELTVLDGWLVVVDELALHELDGQGRLAWKHTNNNKVQC